MLQHSRVDGAAQGRRAERRAVIARPHDNADVSENVCVCVWSRIAVTEEENNPRFMVRVSGVHVEIFWRQKGRGDLFYMSLHLALADDVSFSFFIPECLYCS